MSVPADLRYTKDHEWIRPDDQAAALGITDYAQQALGDVVFIELPEVGASFEAGDAIGVVESVKAASDIYTPVSGEVVEVNEQLNDAPETVNAEPYDTGWIVKLKLTDPAQLDDLMEAAAYEQYLEQIKE